jgi:hypothetical protein
LNIKIEVGTPCIVVFSREFPNIRTNDRVLAIIYTLACLTWESSLLITTRFEVGIVEQVVDSKVDRDRLAIFKIDEFTNTYIY